MLVFSRDLFVSLENNENTEPNVILKSGVGSMLLLEMDDVTFKKHFRLTRNQFEVLNSKLSAFENDAPQCNQRNAKVPMKIKTAMFLWYMANHNSFREIGDKFNVAQSTAHETIVRIIQHISRLASQYIQWPNQHNKETNARVFKRISGIDLVIGAIDGCHIKFSDP